MKDKDEEIEKIIEDLDGTALNYIINFPAFPEPQGKCIKCDGDIRVFSFKGGLCIKCYLKRE